MAINNVLVVGDSANRHHVIRQGAKYCVVKPAEAVDLSSKIAALT